MTDSLREKAREIIRQAAVVYLLNNDESGWEKMEESYAAAIHSALLSERDRALEEAAALADNWGDPEMRDAILDLKSKQ